MIRNIFFCFFCYLTVSGWVFKANAQNDYVVKQKGDTLYGKLKPAKWTIFTGTTLTLSLPTYKMFLNGRDVKSFQRKNIRYLIVALPSMKEKANGANLVFMQILEDGPMKLLLYESNFEKPAQQLFLLNNNSEEVVKMNGNVFYNVLLPLFKSHPVFVEQTQNELFSFDQNDPKSLKNIRKWISLYNLLSFK